jgi:hypothetical protein
MSITGIESDDIFADWKRHRFVMVDQEFDAEKITAVLTDIRFWTDNYDLLRTWCAAHDCELRGMTVEIPSQQTATLFSLRWS